MFNKNDKNIAHKIGAYGSTDNDFGGVMYRSEAGVYYILHWSEEQENQVLIPTNKAGALGWAAEIGLPPEAQACIEGTCDCGSHRDFPGGH